MFTALFSSVESGLIYAIMALGVYLSFRILDFPDLTVDGSFVTGAAICAALIVNGVNPFSQLWRPLPPDLLQGVLLEFFTRKGKSIPCLQGS